VVVPKGDCEEGELIAFCRERLANFKVPKTVEFRDEIPTSPLGKVLRKYLV
jgi:long-chain acyl-CoA synthetase